MAFGRDERKSELIEQAVEHLRRRLEGEKAERAERFLRRFYTHVPPDEILGETPENLYGAALSLWRLARDRPPGEAKVRAYNPRPESHGWRSKHTIVEIVNDDMPFLVDSTVAAVQGEGAEVHLVIHPVLQVRRDETGRLVEIGERGAAPR